MSIVENNNRVKIDGEEIIGFITEKICPTCGSNQIYYEKFDSYFCPQCNVWLEAECADPKCEYCNHRPSKPLKNN